MKTIEVCAAIIIKENKILITQRGYGDFKGGWEFPGGKIEQNESKEDCIIREIKEELSADIKVIKYLNTIKHDYPKFSLIMHNFICEFVSSEFCLMEHEAAKFVEFNEIEKVDFLPADLLIIPDLKNYLSSILNCSNK